MKNATKKSALDLTKWDYIVAGLFFLISILLFWWLIFPWLIILLILCIYDHYHPPEVAEPESKPEIKITRKKTTPKMPKIEKLPQKFICSYCGDVYFKSQEICSFCGAPTNRH